MAFSKIAGFEVTPRSESSRISRSRPPHSIMPRRIWSSQTLVPASVRAARRSFTWVAASIWLLSEQSQFVRGGPHRIPYPEEGPGHQRLPRDPVEHKGVRGLAARHGPLGEHRRLRGAPVGIDRRVLAAVAGHRGRYLAYREALLAPVGQPDLDGQQPAVPGAEAFAVQDDAVPGRPPRRVEHQVRGREPDGSPGHVLALRNGRAGVAASA